MRLASEWTSHKSDAVVKYLAVDAPLLWERPPQCAGDTDLSMSVTRIRADDAETQIGSGRLAAAG
jgi:hypothetical protein